MSATDRLQAMMARACLSREAPAAFESDLAGFLASQGIPAEDAQALLASPSRLGLYRRLVRHSVTDVIDKVLEDTRARLDLHAPGELDRAIVAFLDEAGPRTPYLRDVPSEFFAFAAPRWRARLARRVLAEASHDAPQSDDASRDDDDDDARLPPWIVDFAELELVEFTIGVAPRPSPPPPLAEVHPDRSLVFADPRRLVRLDWAVHRIPREDLLAAPERREVAILVYRDPEHRSRSVELSPLAASILDRLFAGDALAAAMVSACQQTAHPLDDAVLAGAARLLADLGERGVLLGARDA